MKFLSKIASLDWFQKSKKEHTVSEEEVNIHVEKLDDDGSLYIFSVNTENWEYNTKVLEEIRRKWEMQMSNSSYIFLNRNKDEEEFKIVKTDVSELFMHKDE